MKRLAIAVLLSATTVAAADPVATITGQGVAVDGDGIRFGRVEIRLQGIAAPEWAEG